MHDLAPQQKAIKRKYDQDHWTSNECRAEIAALWGIEANPDQEVSINFDKIETERFGQECHHYAEIRLAQAPNGYWAMYGCYMTSIGGGFSSPTIWSSQAYLDQHQARDAAIDESIKGITSERNRTDSCQSASNIRKCNALVQQLQEAKNVQLSLFG